MSMLAWASNLLDSVDSSAQTTIQQQLSKAKAQKTPNNDRHASHANNLPTASPSNTSSSHSPHTALEPTSSSPTIAVAAPASAIPATTAERAPRRKKQQRAVQQLPSTPPANPATPSTPPAVLDDQPLTSHATETELANGSSILDTDHSASSTSSPAAPSIDTDLPNDFSDDTIATPLQTTEPDAQLVSSDTSDSSDTKAATSASSGSFDDIPVPSPTTPTAPLTIAEQPEAVVVSHDAVVTEPPTQFIAATPPTAAPVAPPPAKTKKASAASSLLPSASAFFSSALASATSSSSLAPSSSASASAPSNSTSSTSSSSSEAAAEIASLRAVWNESREQVAKAKKLLALKEESHSKALQKLSHDWQTAMDAQQAEYEDKARRMQEAMERQTVEFQQAMATRKEYAKEQTAKEAEQQDIIEQLHQQLQQMEEKQQQLTDEREHMMNVHSAALSSHQTLLARLRAEEAERMLALEAELKAKASSFAHRQDRDSSQEDEQIQYTQIAAQLQRELEDKTRQLDRVMAEKRWIEVDQQSLNDQLTTMKARVDEQHKQLQTLQASTRERTQAHLAELNTLKQQIITQQHQFQTLQTHSTTLQQQLDDHQSNNTTTASSSSSHPLSGSQQHSQAEWEDRLRTMTDHLMNKSTQIDRLSAERTALSVQLDDARARLVAFERQAKKERERSMEDMESGGGGGGIKGMGSNGELMVGKGKSVAGRGVVHAVSALDRLGAMTGQMLRRHAWVRVSFAAYVFVIHVWVLFILFHLIGEMESGVASAVDDVVIASNAAAAGNSFVRSRSHQLGNG